MYHIPYYVAQWGGGPAPVLGLNLRRDSEAIRADQ